MWSHLALSSDDVATFLCSELCAFKFLFLIMIWALVGLLGRRDGKWSVGTITATNTEISKRPGISLIAVTVHKLIH